MKTFTRTVHGMPHLGQGKGWTESTWRRAPRKRIPLDRLVSTNLDGYLNPRIVTKYAKRPGGDPYVIEADGWFYIADGHHRAAAAIARGEQVINARVKRPGDR